MKKLLSYLFKIAVAGLLALLLASAVCFIYSNPAIHSTNTSGATDYIWEREHFTSTMTEGIAWNVTDKNGFYNLSDTDMGMDILLMGSSHMEGSNVFMRQSTAQLLSAALDRSVYNIGTAGHTMLRCVNNLPAALCTMQPKDYVIIETSATLFTAAEISECLEGRIAPIPSNDSRLMFLMQKIGYLRLAYHQLELMLAKSSASANAELEAQINASEQDYEALAGFISETCRAYGVRPILMYHTNLLLNEDASVTANVDEQSRLLLKAACENNGIVFVDMTDDFLAMYESERVFPNGFCNTPIAYGHLNANGHRAIATRLATVIETLDNATAEVKNA